MVKKYSFYAGAAKGDITPAEELFPIPFIGPIAIDRVCDRIYVRALMMDDGSSRILFMTLDVCILPHYKEMEKLISEETGIPQDHIFMAATHTHEVPITGAGDYLEGVTEEPKRRKWYEALLKTVLDTAKEAERNLRPARIGYGTGKSYVNANRDALPREKGGKSEIGINFERPSDKTLALVRIEDLDGKTIALIINYAVHAVVLNGCIVEGGIGLSGDLPGRTSALLEEKIDGAVVLWTSGAAGDQNPRIMGQYGIEIRDGNPYLKNLEEKGYMILDFLTAEHVEDILEVNDRIVCEEEEAEIYSAERTAVCPGRKAEKDPVSYTLRLLTVGEIAFEGISAEVVTSVGKAVREDSPYRKTILVSHACGYCGYVPDDWEYEHDAFEAEGTPVKQGYAQPAFIRGFRELFKERMGRRK
ncbi:hypothetical protein B5F07_09025 [Lachnoclostridium sp. An169]|uniref:neutral/alkaline non-lysosomal ceramidase N-terminal domain-containing protein n=1 Tax=Lachnoclostridium sp. An169 TaxID=1965569 RepID=UPI000B36924B|nr:neutral/alkaline non-lysosomal ceramidase N-terminal domain-containing protein [Lachnoclostridium sp. An169]OUP83984.1 hypothetical protein B5F07_09025 [Lachnoclostridium sp. An169]